MSLRPMNLQPERQYKFGFISTPCIDLFWFFICGFWFKDTINSSQVKMSVLSFFTNSLLKYDAFLVGAIF